MGYVAIDFDVLIGRPTVAGLDECRGWHHPELGRPFLHGAGLLKILEERGYQVVVVSRLERETTRIGLQSANLYPRTLICRDDFGLPQFEPWQFSDLSAIGVLLVGALVAHVKAFNATFDPWDASILFRRTIVSGRREDAWASDVLLWEGIWAEWVADEAAEEHPPNWRSAQSMEDVLAAFPPITPVGCRRAESSLFHLDADAFAAFARQTDGLPVTEALVVELYRCFGRSGYGFNRRLEQARDPLIAMVSDFDELSYLWRHR